MQKLIDIDALFQKHAPRAYKTTPKFIINYIKKIVHQQEINDFLNRTKNIIGVDFIKMLIESFDVKIKVSGLEKFADKSKKYVFASNHPLGGFDGICLLGVISNYFGNVKAIVNELLLYIENLQPVFTGVNVFGKLNREQLLKVDELFQNQDTNILVFPAGEVSRKRKGKIVDSQWQKSFLVKSIEYKRDIVPVFTDAYNSRRFYNISILRRFFGIKANLELFLLPDELFKFKGKTINFYFGDPIPIEQLSDKSKLLESIQYIRDNVYSLKNANSKLVDFQFDTQVIANQ